MATISERLRKLSRDMLANDMDMLLPEGSADPSEGADIIDDPVKALDGMLNVWSGDEHEYARTVLSRARKE